jgi:hypothetical protein
MDNSSFIGKIVLYLIISEYLSFLIQFIFLFIVIFIRSSNISSLLLILFDGFDISDVVNFIEICDKIEKSFDILYKENNHFFKQNK